MGAGINSGYGIGGWDGLISDMREGITHTPPKSLSTDILIDFEKRMLNTNYIAPQILKDKDVSEYEKVLYNNLYSKFNPSDIEKSIERT